MDGGDVDALKAQIAALTAAVQALAGERRPAHRAGVTVGQLAEYYERHVSRHCFYNVGPFVKAFSARPVSSIRKAEFLAWRDKRADETSALGRKRSPGALNQELAQVLAMLRRGVEDELLDANPLEGVKKLAGQHPRETEIDPGDHDRAFATAPLLVRVFQGVCIETGMRNGCEVRLMERAHVDRVRNVIYVPRENAKGKRRSREVPMSDYCRELIDALPAVANSVYIFANPQTREPYSAAYLGRLSRPYLDRLAPAQGDRRVVTHDARHSVVSQLARGGLGPLPAMKLIGHASPGQHWRYMHISDVDRAKAKRVLDERRRQD